MFEKQLYDSPPMYSPPSNHYGPRDSFLPPQSDFDPYPPPPGSYYIGEEVPQHFYKWTSPPGIIKIMECAIVVLCLGIFACVASTLVWDMQYGAGYGLGSGYGPGSFGSNYYSSGYQGSGYYGGYNYVSPYSAKSAMIAMAAINFIVALAIFVATFSKTQTIRSRKFYLVVLVCSVILAALQGIINIVYIVGVNPMAQSSANAFYNPMLMMCQSLYGNSVTGMGGGFPLYNQYLYHYCYVDPQEVNHVGDGQSVQEASVMFSEKGAPPLNKSQSVTSIPFKGDPYTPPAYSERCVSSRVPDPESSSPSERTERKPAALRGKRRRRNPELDESHVCRPSSGLPALQFIPTEKPEREMR
ncbi:Occludin [Bagarius yarrelli]|uniref:Occludin n=1 Tax=Bagarius yarrelli TaxID=175774 RepID=A0A556VXR8_BAGYA|nr:Occludin [Bagarius yarrelli]